jgi:hypothetical protein
VQEDGDPISIDQLRRQRAKHTPTREKHKYGCELSQAAIDLLVTHTDMGESKLLGLVNDQIRLVRATADGRGRAGAGAGRAAHPRADGVCRCRRVGIPSPLPS